MVDAIKCVSKLFTSLCEHWACSLTLSGGSCPVLSSVCALISPPLMLRGPSAALLPLRTILWTLATLVSRALSSGSLQAVPGLLLSTLLPGRPQDGRLGHSWHSPHMSPVSQKPLPFLA